jgi:hypothetical protein
MKLEIEDLRIGNWVKRTNKHTKETLNYQLVASDFTDISHNGENSSFVYEPIPLTEDLLFKCGGIKRKRLSLFNIYDFDGLHLYPEKNYYQLGIVGSSVKLCDVKYLHDLQNIFRDLTKTNLETTL